VQVRVVVLVALACGAVAVLLVGYWLSVRTRSGQRIEEASRRARDVVPEDIVSGAWTLIDTVSVASLAAVTAAVALIAMLRGRPRLAVTVGGAVLAANVAAQLLKREVLTRPDIIGAGENNSYPSGHATVAMSVLLALVLVVPERWRSVVGAAGLVYPIGIGVGVVTAGWHRPSDVVGSWMVCLAVFSVAAALLIAATGYGTGSPRWRATTEVAAVAVVVSAILLVVGVAGLNRAARWIEDGTVSGMDEAVIVMAFAAAITAGAIVTVTALLLAMRGVSLDRPSPPAF
jgi:hypothetical protein